MDYLKVEVYIPVEIEGPLIATLNAAGLLGEGAYDTVYASTPVTGHWRPLEGADPHDGVVGERSAAPELKIEFRVPSYERYRTEALIREEHPYEEPVINFLELR